MAVRAYIVDLGASNIESENGAATAQCMPASGAPYSETPIFQCLGVTSLPVPADTDGAGEIVDAAQGIMLTGLAGADGVLIGARDTRDKGIVGKMKPGDTIVHTTGPDQRAQLQLKAEKGQCALVTKNAVGKDFGVLIDGNKNTVTVTCPQAGTVHMTKDDGLVLTDQTGKASIQLVDGNVIIMGNAVVLGGRTPTTFVAGIASPTGTGVDALPQPGVYIGR